MYIETKNKISKREGGPKGKSLTWRCFYFAVFAETTPLCGIEEERFKRTGEVKPLAATLQGRLSGEKNKMHSR